MTKLNFDAWREQRRADRRQRLNATCPHCDTDLLKELESAANEGAALGDGDSESIALDCPTCQAEIEFRIYWTVEIRSAEITLTTPGVIEP